MIDRGGGRGGLRAKEGTMNAAKGLRWVWGGLG